MKKNIIIFCTALTALSLTAFGIINRNDSITDQIETTSNDIVATNAQVLEKIEKRIFSDFIYDVGPRFWPIKKNDVENARSIIDFLSTEQTQWIVNYKSVEVIIIIDDKHSDIVETGNSGVLTDAQLKLLKSLDYSTNIKIRADYLKKNMETGKLEDSYSSPHLTIVPEKQAVYAGGKEALMEYLKENSKESRVNVDANKLQPAKLFFTVTKEGTIEKVYLDRSSNYPSVDQRMIELITKAPGKWVPAENFKGEKVDQELVVSFGLMGC